MPAPPRGGEELHFTSCMYALPPEAAGVEDGRRPVATVPARPRPGPRGKKAPYRHVPHRDKPPQLVARRNARERRRVQAVNAAFVRLRQAVPGDAASNRGKRVSKVKTLQRAIEYICLLQELLTEDQLVQCGEAARREASATGSAQAARWAECKGEDEEEEDFESLLQDFEHHF